MTKAPPIKYERGPCQQCGAKTEDEAGNVCQQTQDQTGEWSCCGEFDRSGFSIVPTAASIAALDAWIEQR